MAEKYELAYVDYKAGMKQKEIAAKYDVSINTVKSWQQRKWKEMDASADSEGIQKDEKVCTPKRKTKEGMHTKQSEGATVKDARPDIDMVVEAFVEETKTNAELSEVQRFFCLYFVKYLNATKAYQKAYECTYDTANSNAYLLMVKHGIRAEIERLKKARAAGIMLDKNDVLQKYIDIAFADLGDYVEYGTEDIEMLDFDGNLMLDADGFPKTYKRSYVRLKSGVDLDNSIVSEVKQGKDGVSVKLHSKMDALNVLAKYTDLLDERTKMQLQVEKSRVELIRAELNKQQQTETQNLELEHKRLEIERTKNDIELAKIKIAKENGTHEDEYEDDGFLEALKGTEVKWDE